MRENSSLFHFILQFIVEHVEHGRLRCVTAVCGRGWKCSMVWRKRASRKCRKAQSAFPAFASNGTWMCDMAGIHHVVGEKLWFRNAGCTDWFGNGCLHVLKKVTCSGSQAVSLPWNLQCAFAFCTMPCAAMSHLACAACQRDVFKMLKQNWMLSMLSVQCYVLRCSQRFHLNPKELLRNCNSVKYIRDRLKIT